MKYARLFNVIRTVALVLAAAGWVVGAFRQHPGRKGIHGWLLHAVVLSWGIALLATAAGMMAEGKIKLAHRDSLNLQNDRAKYWILVGTFSIVGSMCLIAGVVKLITDFSGAS